jgi:hypothetical protein
MSGTLNILSVKCIKPSSGIDTFAKSIFGAIGGAAGGAVGVATTAASGGILVAATAIGFTGGVAAGVAIIEGLDNFFSGADDLYLNVNNSKIWPSGQYEGINSQETKTIDYSLPLDADVTIELMEYDTVGANDKLGYLTVYSTHQDGNYTYLVQNEGEGSIYEINIRVFS